MQISEINNKDELSSLIINELKDIGVKYRKEKKTKVVQEKSCRKRIFRTHLHLLELTDVILANGGVVQIPRFVADACNRILEQVETEGIFRKAGSSLRQKEIRLSLEAGHALGKSHHVVDVANVVKSFFRELPDPLIPQSMQETLLRGLLIGENHIKAILLTCLLLPPLTINTLSFFMQFLHTVALSAHCNRMSMENLAIVFTPGLMPFSDISSLRFNNHVKMVRLLIENANSIGTIPNSIIDKLHIHEVVSNTPSKSRSFEALEIVATQKKKKKRRSEMFNGLRKMVGSALGSSENLENTPENIATTYNALAADQRQQHSIAATPCVKSTKKRKFTEPACAFSAKKKKDLLALLPNNSGGFLPNTPLTKEPKKSRLSLGGRRNLKSGTSSTNPALTSMERRWSIVGSGWTRNRNKNSIETKKDNDDENKTSKSCISKLELPKTEFPIMENVSFAENVSVADCSEVCDSDFVRISKNEYEAIKERVAAIETRISQEFGSIRNSFSRRSLLSTDELNLQDLSGPERVVTKYEQVVESTEVLTSPSTEHLAQRLSRGLKIRRSTEQQVIRSPSARKIGTMRRRSQEKLRLSRNQTWHISSTTTNSALGKLEVPLAVGQNCFYAKSNLKRGRPNTLNTGLLQQQCTAVKDPKHAFDSDKFVTDEDWTDGGVFFNNVSSASSASMPPKILLNYNDKSMDEMEMAQRIDEVQCTPAKTRNTNNGSDNIKTPMLPPKSVPRKIACVKTPNSTMKTASASKVVPINRMHVSTPIEEEVNGRASIARLRTQNAGMVMAKAKLFDGLVGNNNSDGESQHSHGVPIDVVNRRKSNRFGIHVPNVSEPKSKTNIKEEMFSIESKPASLESPCLNRKKNVAGKSPGFIQKRHRPPLIARYPDKHVLNTIVADRIIIESRKATVETANFRNLNNIKNCGTSSPCTLRMKKHFSVNSPRRARNQEGAKGSLRIRTPLKHCAQGKQRNSPRLAKVKTAGRKAT